ncbi:hypothetical protein HK102_009000, partial [Quaeritorhiza haematococci]
MALAVDSVDGPVLGAARHNVLEGTLPKLSRVTIAALFQAAGGLCITREFVEHRRNSDAFNIQTSMTNPPDRVEHLSEHPGEHLVEHGQKEHDMQTKHKELTVSQTQTQGTKTSLTDDPPIVDGTFVDATEKKIKPLEVSKGQDFFTVGVVCRVLESLCEADININILNQLYAHALKVFHIAAAFTPAAFEKTPGASLRVARNVVNPTGGNATTTLSGLRRFFLQEKQRQRIGAQANPTTAVVPLANRHFLKDDSVGVGNPLQRSVRAQKLRVLHAREDAETYKKPISALWNEFFHEQRPQNMSAFNSLVEERIAENRMIKSQGYLPPWVELGKEIDQDIDKFRGEMKDLWNKHMVPPDKKRDARLQQHQSGTMSRWAGMLRGLMAAESREEGSGKFQEDRAGWEINGRQWAQLRVDGINHKVRKFNIEAPEGVTRRLRLEVAAEMDR